MSLQPLSEKQLKAYHDSTARINIFEGPVRAGKTFSSLLRWIDYSINGPPGQFLVTGRSQSSLKRNFIIPMMELLGSDFQYSEGKREIRLFDRLMFVVGANDERATGKIQGATFAGAWIDEVALLPESFFKMILSRLSIDGAKLFATTNPDSPLHWLKKDYIDRSDELDIKVFSFNLDDNPSLSEDYKTNLKKEYQGLWYKRYILGQWVLAEGSIYDFFNDEVHVVKQAPTYAKYWILGIDYGTTNPFGAVLIGYNDDSHPALWVEKEYYYDSRARGRQKTDSEYCQEIKNFFSHYPIKMIYLDPSAASFQVELKRNRLPVKQANNEVLDGIRFVSSLLMQGDLVVKKECTNLIKEIYGYVWDDKSIKLGEDKPLKQGDHLCDALRYALFTHFGARSSLQETKPQTYNPTLWSNPNFQQPIGWRNL